MSATPIILSHKKARLRRRQNQNRGRPKPRLDLLPVELQLAILETVSTCEDLEALVASSPTIRAVYHEYKKTILAHVIQATLGEAFIEACMLQHWRSNIDTYGTETREENEAEVDDPDLAAVCPQAPYRHIRLKFLHDWYEHNTASAEDQIQNVKDLLTAEDFEQIMSFYVYTVEPLSRLFIEEPAPVHDFTLVYVDLEPEDDPLPPWKVTVTEWQRIMRTLYRFEICCRLYGPDSESSNLWFIAMGSSHCQMMERDFFGMFDPSENEEFSFVYTQLASQLHKSLALIEDNMDWRRRQDARALYGLTVSPYGAWRRTDVPLGLEGWIAGALSIGLGLLSTIRWAGSADEVADILMSVNPPILMGFMWGSIRWLREAYHFSGGGESAWPDSWSDAFWK